MSSKAIRNEECYDDRIAHSGSKVTGRLLCYWRSHHVALLTHSSHCFQKAFPRNSHAVGVNLDRSANSLRAREGLIIRHGADPFRIISDAFPFPIGPNQQLDDGICGPTVEGSQHNAKPTGPKICGKFRARKYELNGSARAMVVLGRATEEITGMTRLNSLLSAQWHTALDEPGRDGLVGRPGAGPVRTSSARRRLKRS